jgi:hypothetical protein
MKSIIFVVALLIIASNSAFSQSKDTSATKQDQQNVQQKKTDKFVDRDGDGICDRREQGLGFKRGKHRGEKQRGKNQSAQDGKGTTGTVQPTGSGTGQQYRGGK